MKDSYNTYLRFKKIIDLLGTKEYTGGVIAKKTKFPVATTYRMLKSLDKHNIVTTKDTKGKYKNQPLKLYKLKTIGSQS